MGRKKIQITRIMDERNRQVRNETCLEMYMAEITCSLNKVLSKTVGLYFVVIPVLCPCLFSSEPIFEVMTPLGQELLHLGSLWSAACIPPVGRVSFPLHLSVLDMMVAVDGGMVPLPGPSSLAVHLTDLRSFTVCFAFPVLVVGKYVIVFPPRGRQGHWNVKSRLGYKKKVPLRSVYDISFTFLDRFNYFRSL